MKERVRRPQGGAIQLCVEGKPMQGCKAEAGLAGFRNTMESTMAGVKQRRRTGDTVRKIMGRGQVRKGL